MRKLVTGSLVAAAALCAAQPAFAQSSGTITINGEIVDSTCVAAVNGANGNTTVTLPTVDVDQLANAGDNTGWSAVQISLTGCTTAGIFTNVVPHFSPSNAASVTTGGRLVNLGGTATNVEVGLSTTGGLAGAINVNGTVGNQNVTPQPLASNPTFNIYAGYVATGTATAGTVSAQVAYTLAYL